MWLPEYLQVRLSRKYSSLEDALMHPKRVRRLSLVCWTGNLNHYAESFVQFTNLVELDIHTDISHEPFLPAQLGELKKLRKLHLLNVPFQEFPEWIKKLTNLEDLMVRGCELSTLPGFIGTLRKLRKLRIENCKLNALPLELKFLDKLQSLSFVDTSITYTPLENIPPNLTFLNLGIPGLFYTGAELKRLKKIAQQGWL